MLKLAFSISSSPRLSHTLIPTCYNKAQTNKTKNSSNGIRTLCACVGGRLQCRMWGRKTERQAAHPPHDLLTLSQTHERKLHSSFHYSHNPVTQAPLVIQRHTHTHTHTSFWAIVIKARSRHITHRLKHLSQNIKRFHCSSEALRRGRKWIRTQHPAVTAGP